MQVRIALQEDMPQVLELIRELARFEKEPDAVDISTEDLVKEGFSDQPLFHCFVAENDDQIVGMALVYFRFSTWKGRTLHLEDLIVKEDYRGKGIGEALYTAVMKYGHEQGVKRVEWVVLDWNYGALKFYERSGATILKDWYLAQMDEQSLENFIKRIE
ncbi:GNAT family N-acetyltransferase [Aureitalea marina]|uniref:GNAT family N-acetyltransferase n=1 Tax=Aureitalea marina TaxID=930804 RepID=A0A2S7KRL8_9FLAO|nr:GNAT family N-acetyltransferase [Aureitalea marina]PQB05272.1 GNAT family N-acetyltransferase [Aureitalea marina]